MMIPGFTDRKSESEAAARILRRILEQNPQVFGLAPRDRKWALQLAISLLEARAIDAEDEQ
jgi:hypothetical protein